MNLTPHFTEHEATYSYNATRAGVSNDMSSDVRAQVIRLLRYYMEPIRAVAGDKAVIVHSLYRNPQVNALAGGSGRSYHLHGCAIDFDIDGMSALDTCRFVLSMGLPFDELIYEFGGWCHLAMPVDVRDAPRLTTKTIYTGASGAVIVKDGLHVVPTRG